MTSTRITTKFVYIASRQRSLWKATVWDAENWPLYISSAQLTEQMAIAEAKQWAATHA